MPTMPYTVMVAMTVDAEDPEQAIAFVRAELLSKLGVGEPVWQTGEPHRLPRWELGSVRRVARQDETGAEVQ